MLKPKEIAEISLYLWYLPLPQLDQVKTLVMQMVKEHGYKEPTDDSDEWTEEDRRDLQEASLKEWDRREEAVAAPEAEVYRRIRPMSEETNADDAQAG